MVITDAELAQEVVYLKHRKVYHLLHTPGPMGQFGRCGADLRGYGWLTIRAEVFARSIGKNRCRRCWPGVA